MGRFSIRNILLAAASAVTLAACAAGPDYAAPQTPSSAAGAFIGARSPLVTGDTVADDWWRLYNDPVLDRLVADAIAANKDLGIATARVARARAALREAGADRLPSTNVSAGATYGRQSQGQRSLGTDREGWTYDGGLNVAYEVDLFGRVARDVEAARGEAAAATADLDAARVAVIAETVRAYSDASSAAERLGVAERTVALLDEGVRLTTKRFEAGRAARLDVSRVTALRERQYGVIPSLRADRDAALFRLATLTGRTPADLPPEAGQRASSPRVDAPLRVGDGRALIARRPDVRAAERRLAAETARIGVATAELYPSISLGGGIGSTSASLTDLFGAGPLRWIVGPLLSWNIPNQSVARARIAGAEASAQEALARFDKLVLMALEETETALSRYKNEVDRRTALEAARNEAVRAATIVRAQLREGRADSLAVIDAERTLAENEFELAASRGRVASAQVDLFRALGGGWRSTVVRDEAQSD